MDLEEVEATLSLLKMDDHLTDLTVPDLVHFIMWQGLQYRNPAVVVEATPLPK